MVIADFSGNFLNADTAKDSDIIEIIGEGSYSDKDFGKGNIRVLDLPVSNGTKKLTFSPNMDAGKKLVRAFGTDTANWIGKKFSVNIVRIKSFGQVKETLDITPIVY